MARRPSLSLALRWLARAFARAAAVCALGLGAPGLASDPAVKFSVGVPAGFDTLAQQQRAVVDLWTGGRRIGEAMAEFGPEGFRFADPAAVAAKIEDLADRAPVVAALSAPSLAENRDRLCRGDGPQGGCGVLRPEVAGIIFDAAHYRVDLFVNPKFLTVRAAQASDFLAPPPGGLSLVNAVGLTLAGTSGHAAQYALTDAAVLGVGSARLRTGLSYSSYQGFKADTLTAEIDRRRVRYSAGFFWSPGDELLGRRRILGAGIASQFDTRTDRDQIEGTPLVVFLDTRSRVDVLVGGRLVATGLYEAGNQALDTSGLPEGSYDVELRITGGGGRTRSERRLFSRTRRLPPMGLDGWQAVVGVLVDDGAAGPLGRVSRTPFVQANWAHRLKAGLAVHAGLVGTDARQFARAGATVLSPGFQLEATALASPQGDLGLFARASSRGGGRLAFDLEGRVVESRDKRPLLPDVQTRTIALNQSASFAPAGSYGQVTGSVSYQIGSGRIAASATWRSGGEYAAGPSFRLPVLHGKAFDIVAQGDYSVTNRGRSGYIGLSLVLNRGRTNFIAEGGWRETRSGGSGRVAPMGLIRATTQREGAGGEQLQASAALGRDDGNAYAAGELLAANRLGEASASLMQPIGGSGGTQYALSLRTGMAAAGAGVKLGLSNSDSGVVVAVRGASADDRFDVLVGDVPMGRIVGAGKVMVPLPAYRTYDVRIRAAGTGMLTYDTAVRRVTLYPGTVAGLRWMTARTLAVSGRLVDPAGGSLAGADLSSGPNIAETDADGSFVIELDAARTIIARTAAGLACTLRLGAVEGRNSFAAIGTRICATEGATASTALASPAKSH